MVLNLCHRCANPLELGTAFCSSCGAPQIRVVAPEPPPEVEPELVEEAAEETAVVPQDAAFSVASGTWRSIDWRAFLRIALPLAFLSGTFSAVPPAVGLALLPAAVILAVARYRKEHSLHMTPSQGAWLGACTGLLSFVFFLVFAGMRAAMNSAEMRQNIKSLQEELARNPDPSFQQMANWIVTPPGIIFFFVLGMVVVLAVFVGLATVTGTLTAAFSGNRNRR
ncbi:MAG TPA: hypothetical protein VNW97_18855 [Candidatus Saccharimonadales bacterium]|jgi:hypothetical protein|nr:hypothetical protein [Candidatus Saccharimonadales bacterium]